MATLCLKLWRSYCFNLSHTIQLESNHRDCSAPFSADRCTTQFSRSREGTTILLLSTWSQAGNPSLYWSDTIPHLFKFSSINSRYVYYLVHPVSKFKYSKRLLSVNKPHIPKNDIVQVVSTTMTVYTVPLLLVLCVIRSKWFSKALRIQLLLSQNAA